VLEVSLPPNTEATVMLPAVDEQSLSATGRYNQPDIGITFEGVKKHTAVWHILSGKYRFVSRSIVTRLPHALLTAPLIRPGDTLLHHGDTLTVTLHTDHKGAEIRYTLDGTLPDSTSPLYTHPLVITRDTRLTARTYKKGYRPGPVTRRTFSFINPAIHGLRYTYYSGLWQQVPAFSRLTPSATGILHQLDLNGIPYNKDRFALHITGTIRIPATGNYTFYLSSNDGSRLYLDGRQIVENDGPHPAREREGKIFLTQGIHKITIGYMQVGGGYYLSLGWKGPGITKETIPPSNFFFGKNRGM
jgi:hypothetical protein